MASRAEDAVAKLVGSYAYRGVTGCNLGGRARRETHRSQTRTTSPTVDLGPGGPASLQARDYVVVVRHHPRRRPRPRGHRDRRGLRGDGLALVAPGRHRGVTRQAPPLAWANPALSRLLRPVLVVDGGEEPVPSASFGHSRDAKRGKLHIEYLLSTHPSGRPVAIRSSPATPHTPPPLSRS